MLTTCGVITLLVVLAGINDHFPSVTDGGACCALDITSARFCKTRRDVAGTNEKSLREIYRQYSPGETSSSSPLPPLVNVNAWIFSGLRNKSCIVFSFRRALTWLIDAVAGVAPIVIYFISSQLLDIDSTLQQRPSCPALRSNIYVISLLSLQSLCPPKTHLGFGDTAL